MKLITGRARIGPDTPQRPAQILRREHLLPQRDLQAGNDSIPGVRRPAATLSCGAQRDSPSPPGSWPAYAGWLRLLRPARAAPIPPPHPAFGPSRPVTRSPAGTTTSADFCPVSARLTAGPLARRQTEQAHPDRPAFYAVRVPRCRVLPRASFPPRLTTTQLPPARS